MYATRTLYTLTLGVLLMAIGGCKEYARWQETQARADVQHEQSEILKLYRECLTQYKGKPQEARANCEHYTQALTVFDVRGIR